MTLVNIHTRKNEFGSDRTFADYRCDGPTCTGGVDGGPKEAPLGSDEASTWASFDDFDMQGTSHFCSPACLKAWAAKL